MPASTLSQSSVDSLHILMLGSYTVDRNNDQSDLAKTVRQIEEKHGERVMIKWIKESTDELPNKEFLDKVEFVYLGTSPSDKSFDSIIEQIPLICPNAKNLHVRTTGINGIAAIQSIIDAEAAGLIVTNARDCYHESLAEWVLFSASYFLKDQWRLVQQKKDHNWNQFFLKGMTGLKIAIIGIGSIGTEVARIAKMGYKMHVTGLKRTLNPGDSCPYADELVLTSEESLCKVFAESDVVCSVLPLTPETKGLISKKVINSGHKDLIFINIGRGQNVDQVALVEALNNDVIKAAALDVFEQEPIPSDDPIWEVPDHKILMSPHCCDWTTDLDIKSGIRYAMMVDNVINKCFDMNDRVWCKRGY